MRVDLIHSSLSPEKEKELSGREKCQDCAFTGNLEFSKVLEIMMHEMGELKKAEKEKPEEIRQELGNFIRSVEKADEKFQTAMSFRKVLLEAYRNVAQKSEG